MVDCYIGLGGNFRETLSVMQQVTLRLKSQKGINSVCFSRLYRTTPVSDISQPHYLNAVCRFQTELSLEELWEKVQNLEKEMGKQPKQKNAARLIDLDLLFYGSFVTMTEHYTIPHPRWHERLFVLTPLADVTKVIPLEEGLCIEEFLRRFSNPHREKISLYREAIL